MKHIFFYILVIFISACGWHLRGSVANDNNLMGGALDLVITAEDNHSTFVSVLRKALTGYQIKEVNLSTPETMKLILGKETIDKRTAGVGSDALTSAYEIILRVEYSLAKNEELLTPTNTSASLSRTYNYNVNNANSAAQEEALVLRELQQELAQNILRRIKSLHAKNTAKNK